MAGDEGTSANVNGPLVEALVTGAAEAAVRLSALAAATAAAPAAAQVTARRRRCLTMSIDLLPCGQRRRHGGAAGVGQEYAAPGSPGSDFFPRISLNPQPGPPRISYRQTSRTERRDVCSSAISHRRRRRARDRDVPPVPGAADGLRDAADRGRPAARRGRRPGDDGPRLAPGGQARPD